MSNHQLQAIGFPRDFAITVEQVVQPGRQGLGQASGWWQAFWPARASGADREAVRLALGEVEAGDIATRQIGGLSGGQLQPEHPHVSQFLVCDDCGEVAEVENADVAESLDAAGKAIGFRAKRPVVEVLGACARCNAKQAQ